MFPDGDHSAPSPPLAINVDPDMVSGFAQTVRTNVQGTITPTAPAVANTLDRGIPFGQGNPSIALQAMFERYGECLQHMNRQLANVADYVAILVAAADQISTNYASSDRLATASNEDIDGILNVAIGSIIAKQGSSPADARLGPRVE